MPVDIMFAGTPDFAVAYLNSLLSSEHRVVGVITQPDKPGKRGRKPIPGPVKLAASRHNLRIIQPERLAVSDLQAFSADLLVVVAYGQILPSSVLTWAEYGCINVHASLLPRWRGAAPVQRAILSGDSETGVSIMQMDEGLDTGGILARVTVPVNSSDTAGSLFNTLEQVGSACLLNTIQQLETGSAEPKPQPGTGVTYAKKLSREEARINWMSNPDAIHKLIRAFNPDPIAFTFLDDLRIRIWHAEICSRIPTEEPGTITGITANGITTACLDGSLLLTGIQLPVGKGSILSGQDILNARRDLFRPGKQFINV